MFETVDLAPAAGRLAALVNRIGDDQLAAPSPCVGCTLGDLLDHPPERPDRRRGVFGPPVPVPADAPVLDRVVGLSGRDPAWSAAR